MAKTSFESVVPSKKLEDSLRVGKAIVDFNGGNPIDKLTLAECMKLSPTSSTFIQLVSSSQIYGLTSGSAFSKSISLTTLGKDYFYPRSLEEKNNALFKAATHPPLVKRVYAHFNNNKLPPYDMAKNILIRNFDIKEGKTENAFEIIRANARFSGFLQNIQGSDWINLDKVPSQAGPSEVDESQETQEDKENEEQQPEEKIDEGKSFEDKSPAKVFISHGKNKKVLEQIKTTLEFGNFEPVIAESQETAAIPVPEKVMNAMHECCAGIINISADETVKDNDGNEAYKINENVLIEIGAAFVLYKKKVILVVDKRIKLPSNLQGLYVCYYEGDSLDWASGLKLQKALTEFKR